MNIFTYDVPYIKDRTSLNIKTMLLANVIQNTENVQMYAKFYLPEIWPRRFAVVIDFLEETPPRSLQKLSKITTNFVVGLSLIALTYQYFSVFHPFGKMKVISLGGKTCNVKMSSVSHLHWFPHRFKLS